MSSKHKKKRPVKPAASQPDASTAAAETVIADTAPPKPASAAKTVKPYYAGIDILKILAALFVVGIHTFLYDGFYDARIQDGDTQFIVPIAFRWVFYSCVPIFMTITGYLMKNKKISAKYYTGLIRIIVIYIFIGILCLRADHVVFGFQYEKWAILRRYLEYNAATYGWYVNYYIAIFCMIPFLNMAFNGLENRKQRTVLLVTICLFTTFATALFIGREKDDQIRVLPSYLTGMWPLAYYYVGAYIREYPPKKCILNKLLVLAVLAADVAYITLDSYSNTIAETNAENNYRLTSWHYNDYSTWPVFIIAVCIFLLLFDITTTKKTVKFVLQQLSGATYALFLISYVFDRKVYGQYGMRFPSIHNDETGEWVWQMDRFTHSWQPLLYVFLHSMFWALVITNVYKLLEYLIKKGIAAIPRKPKNIKAKPAAQ